MMQHVSAIFIDFERSPAKGKPSAADGVANTTLQTHTQMCKLRARIHRHVPTIQYIKIQSGLKLRAEENIPLGQPKNSRNKV